MPPRAGPPALSPYPRHNTVQPDSVDRSYSARSLSLCCLPQAICLSAAMDSHDSDTRDAVLKSSNQHDDCSSLLSRRASSRDPTLTRIGQCTIPELDRESREYGNSVVS